LAAPVEGEASEGVPVGVWWSVRNGERGRGDGGDEGGREGRAGGSVEDMEDVEDAEDGEDGGGLTHSVGERVVGEDKRKERGNCAEVLI
jgi:hypothetical protein